MSFNVDIKEEMTEMKEDIKKLQSESLAYEMLKDSVKASKRKDGIIVLLIVLLACSFIYTVYLLHDIGYEEIAEETTTTNEYNQDIDNSGDINNTNIVNGGDING